MGCRKITAHHSVDANHALPSKSAIKESQLEALAVGEPVDDVGKLCGKARCDAK